VLASGGIAHSIFLKRPLDCGTGDLKEMMPLIRVMMHDPSVGSVLDVVISIQKESEKILTEEIWDQVSAVAKELFDRGTLYRGDVKKICTRVKKNRGDGKKN
jgi:hypothetical protein